MGKQAVTGKNIHQPTVSEKPGYATLALQKPRMPQILDNTDAVGVRPQAMGYYRLSRRVNNTVKKPLFLEIMCLERNLYMAPKPLFKLFYNNHTVLLSSNRVI